MTTDAASTPTTDGFHLVIDALKLTLLPASVARKGIKGTCTVYDHNKTQTISPDFCCWVLLDWAAAAGEALPQGQRTHGPAR